jgi:hypothetical protein
MHLWFCQNSGAFVRDQAAMPNTMPNFRHAELKPFDALNY